jgi:phage shock protein A
MPPSHHRILSAVIALSVALAVRAGAADRLFTLSEDGETFLYRARPGDHPTVVAEMFGIAERDLPAFLAANKIDDPTRVGTGFVYRVPNTAAQQLTERAARLERDDTRLRRALAEAKDRVRALEREAHDARATSDSAEARLARLARLEATWPWARALLVLLVLASAGAGMIAFAAMRRQRQAERYARGLATELDDKRRTALAERQESGKRVLDLETRVRALEAQLGPRVLISGRGGS